MGIILSYPKQELEQIIAGNKKFLFWSNLPWHLNKYSGNNFFHFNDDQITLYLCCDNTIQVQCNIEKIYNLHYKKKNSAGLTIIHSRIACIDDLYREWCKINNKEILEDCILDEEFNTYLSNTKLFKSNYAVKLKNVEEIT